MPPETTPQQFSEMLRNLIVGRFHLQFHTETKAIAGYALVVAKSGSKLKESTKESALTAPVASESASGRRRPRQIGLGGFAVLPPVMGPSLRLQAN